jgi:predicted esterase YcpF (UPF0227 family)
MQPAERQPLYYAHGFASAIPEDWSESPKISTVAAFCRATGRAFRPQNIDYREADRRCGEILATVGPDVERVTFCGASMGGWLSRILQLKLLEQRPGLPVDAVVFNPAFNMAEFSHYLEGPQQNYVTGQAFEFTAAHGRRLAALEASVDYRGPAPFRVYVDRDDETIDAAWSERFHAGFAHFVAYPGGSHSFEHAREALADFQPGCWNRARQC